MTLADIIGKLAGSREAGGASRSIIEEVEMTPELADKVQVLGNSTGTPADTPDGVTKTRSTSLQKAPSIQDILIESRDPVAGVPEDDGLTPPGKPAPSELQEFGKSLGAVGKALQSPGVKEAMAQMGLPIGMGSDSAGGDSLQQMVQQASVKGVPQSSAASDSGDRNLAQRIFGAVNEVLANRDVQRGLIAAGTDISGSTGAIGQLGNQLISGAAQSEFREGLESGDLGPGADVDGLLPQGREAVLQSFRSSREQDRRDREQGRRERLVDLKFEQLELDELNSAFDRIITARDLSDQEKRTKIEEGLAEATIKVDDARARLLDTRADAERERMRLLKQGKTEGSITQNARSLNERIRSFKTQLDVIQDERKQYQEITSNDNLIALAQANPQGEAAQQIEEAESALMGLDQDIIQTKTQLAKLSADARYRAQGEPEGGFTVKVSPTEVKTIADLPEGVQQSVLNSNEDYTLETKVGVFKKYNPATQEVTQGVRPLSR